MSKKDRVPKFIDNAESNRYVYDSLLNIIKYLERIRTTRFVSDRTIDATIKVVDRELDDIINIGGPHIAVDVKLYVLNMIEGWIADDLDDEKYESCGNLQKLSNILWKR